MKVTDTEACQREIPIFGMLATSKWVSPETVAGWVSYRDAVVWCWHNRPHRGLNDPDDQALFARHAGVHAPHMSRYVSPHSKAPMDMKPDLIPAFEAYTGHRGVTQYLAKQGEITPMEQVIAEKAA